MPRPSSYELVRRGIFTPASLAALLNVSTTTIRNLCSNGTLPSHKTGRDYRMEADLILSPLIHKGYFQTTAVPVAFKEAVAACHLRRLDPTYKPPPVQECPDEDNVLLAAPIVPPVQSGSFT